MSVDFWFKNHVSENININSEKNTRARISINWLTSNIKDLSQRNEENLELYSDSEFALKMGSFAHKTRSYLVEILPNRVYTFILSPMEC